MNTNTRYILTATGVAAGLFLVGATANALSSDNTATNAPIGAGVVLPSATTDPSASPTLVKVDYAENGGSGTATTDPTVISTGGWGTAPGGSAVGDDDHDSESGDN
jgi:type IV secretory pathway TrbL component